MWREMSTVYGLISDIKKADDLPNGQRRQQINNDITPKFQNLESKKRIL
jgi:hypothetical protein